MQAKTRLYVAKYQLFSEKKGRFVDKKGAFSEPPGSPQAARSAHNYEKHPGEGRGEGAGSPQPAASTDHIKARPHAAESKKVINGKASEK